MKQKATCVQWKDVINPISIGTLVNDTSMYIKMSMILVCCELTLISHPVIIQVTDNTNDGGRVPSPIKKHRKSQRAVPYNILDRGGQLGNGERAQVGRPAVPDGVFDLEKGEYECMSCLWMLIPFTANDPASWISTAFLSSISFQFHLYIGALFCLLCQAFFTPCHVLKHCHNLHKGAKPSPSLHRQLDAVVKQYGIAERPKLLYPPPNQAPIKGLHILKHGYSCNSKGCSYAAYSKETMMTHWKSDHQDMLKYVDTKMRYDHPVHVQQYFKYTYNKYWTVNPALADRPKDDLYSLFLRDLQPKLQKEIDLASPTLSRDIPPWLKVSGFLDYLGDYVHDRNKRTPLFEAATGPKASDVPYGQLHSWVFEYLLSVRDICKNKFDHTFLKHILHLDGK
jgi:Orsellinic acid/F9775 biosynthesis cluster protein D